jgi:glyoxylate/hydroxypyruvate reductase A
MVLLFCVPALDAAPWRVAFRELMPELEVRVWPDMGDPGEIGVLFTFRPPPGLLAKLSSLKLLQVIGAGVDQLAGETVPSGVLVARTVDAGLIEGMVEYVLGQVLHFHRQFDAYDRFQQKTTWQRLPRIEARDRRVGIMGLGPIGTAVAATVASFNFDVVGWSRTPRALASVRTFAGEHEFAAFLADIAILVNLLPLTTSTRGVLCRSLFDRLARGASVINAGRGGHCVTADLVAALDTGQLGGAVLDVFETEPLPADSPLWAHPKIRVTPHIASTASPRTAVPAVVENIRLVMRGERPRNAVDLSAP